MNQKIMWLKVLSAVALLAALVAYYCLTDWSRADLPSIQRLLKDAIPSAVVVLLAFLGVYFLLYRPGLTDAQLGNEDMIRTIVDLVTAEIKSTQTKAIAEMVIEEIQSKQTYEYIEGEREAILALTNATLAARHCIHATRFFTHPIRLSYPEYADAIIGKVKGKYGGQPLANYFRIVGANNRDKLPDVLEYINKLSAYPFTLYLVNHANAFELVIIDSEKVFIHFFGTGKVIASTLRLTGVTVAKKFEKLFAHLHDPRIPGRDVLDIHCKYLTSESKKKEAIRDATKFFDRYAPPKEVLEPEASAAKSELAESDAEGG